jgi:hypothetical protein
VVASRGFSDATDNSRRFVPAVNNLAAARRQLPFFSSPFSGANATSGDEPKATVSASEIHE